MATDATDQELLQAWSTGDRDAASALIHREFEAIARPAAASGDSATDVRLDPKTSN